MEPVRVQAKVVSRDKLASSVHLLTLRAPELARGAEPGQFVMVGPLLEGSNDPFLNRPFSIHRTMNDGGLQLLFGIVGRGTCILGRLQPGDGLWLIGPLGKGFEIPVDAHPVILVAGGLGIAPLFFLAERLAGEGRGPVLLYGACSASGLVPTAELNGRGAEVELATDDGSVGFCGTVSDLLAARLERMPGGQLRRACLAACGPLEMLRSVARQGRRYRLPVQVSIETSLACGVGACRGCTVFAASGEGRRVCCDGPVLDAEEVFGK